MSAGVLDLRRARPRGAADAERLRVVVVDLGSGAEAAIGPMLARAGGVRLDVVCLTGLRTGLGDLAAHPAALVVLHADQKATARLALAEVKRAHPALPVVVVADGDVETSAVQSAVHAVRAGAEDCLTAAGLTGPQLLRAILCALERTSHAASLRTQAVTDPLTGLPNRQALKSALDRALARARRHGQRFAVLFADLDGFKAVNDRHGHEHGDRVLQEMASRFAARTREMDTVARVGGDEFVVVMEDLDDPKSAARLGAKLVLAAAEPVTVAGHTVTLGVSVGISLFPGDGEDAATLLRHADHAMYAAKAAGVGHVRYYQARMNANAKARLAVHAALEQALAGGELALHCQPVWQASERRVVAGELLLRWQRPGHGLVAAAEFLESVRHSDLTARLTAWTVEQAFAHARRIADAGFELPLSVHLSREQLGGAGVAAMWRTHVTTSGLTPAAVQIEVDAAVAASSDPRVASTLAQLASHGVTLVVDDVGREGIPLQAVIAARPRVLKIDASLTGRLPDDRAAAAMVAAITALGRPLGVTVVAEGVEHDAQAKALDALGCDHRQGYLYGHALPPDEWLAYLRWACSAVVGSDAAPTARRRASRRPARVLDLPPTTRRLPGPALAGRTRGDVVVGRFRS